MRVGRWAFLILLSSIVNWASALSQSATSNATCKRRSSRHKWKPYLCIKKRDLKSLSLKIRPILQRIDSSKLSTLRKPPTPAQFSESIFSRRKEREVLQIFLRNVSRTKFLNG